MSDGPNMSPGLNVQTDGCDELKKKRCLSNNGVLYLDEMHTDKRIHLKGEKDTGWFMF